MTEDKIVGWYHLLNGHKFEQPLGDRKDRELLLCFSPWDHKELKILSVCSPGVFGPNLEPVTEDLHYTGLLSEPCQENLPLCPKPPDRSTLDNNGQVGDGGVPA